MVVRYWGNKIACNIVIIYKHCSSVLKMLFIKVWLRLINLVGEVMLRRRLVKYMMSRKSKTFLFQSHFRRSILKSPSNTTFLSLINFSERGFGYSSLNSLCCIHGCLYIYSIFASYYIQCFWSPFRLFHLLIVHRRG